MLWLMNMEIEMKSIKIYRFGTDEDYWKLLVNIYDEFFLNDTKWHCFWEDEFIIIRATAPVDNIETYLDECGLQYDVLDYVDEVVKEFASSYATIYNEISELHMQVYKSGGFLHLDQVRSILDRVVHAFFNMGFGTLSEFNKDNLEGVLEATLLTNMAQNRAFHAGVRHHYKRSQLDKGVQV